MSEYKTRDELLDDIAALSHAQAVFALQALVVAGHVTSGLMQKTIEFSDTLNWGKKP